MSNDTLNFAGVGAVAFPTGNTIQRPTGQLSMFRYNTDILNFEGFVNGNWQEFGVNAVSSGVYESPFNSGYIQYTGPGNSFTSNINFIIGNNIPNPSGVNAPCLLIGSGVPQAWIITDQAYHLNTPGTNLGITAGETQPGSSANGGYLQIYGGATSNGTGGAVLVQGGTSVNGSGGDVTISGGGSTSNVAGNVYIIGGQTGNQGGSLKLIFTTLNNISGFLYIENNSTILYAISNTGAIYIGGTSPGLAGQPLVSGASGASPSWQTGVTANIITAKLTVGGANGWMNFVQGILVTQQTAT